MERALSPPICHLLLVASLLVACCHVEDRVKTREKHVGRVRTIKRAQVSARRLAKRLFRLASAGEKRLAMVAKGVIH